MAGNGVIITDSFGINTIPTVPTSSVSVAQRISSMAASARRCSSAKSVAEARADRVLGTYYSIETTKKYNLFSQGIE